MDRAGFARRPWAARSKELGLCEKKPIAKNATMIRTALFNTTNVGSPIMVHLPQIESRMRLRCWRARASRAGPGKHLARRQKASGGSKRREPMQLRQSCEARANVGVPSLVTLFQHAP